MHMLNEETSLLNQGKTSTESLMTSFVQALNTHQKKETIEKSNAGQSSSKSLTVEEIFDNIFVINFADHDTIVNTLTYSMLLLAAHPEVQGWVAEELQIVTPCDTEKWDYHILFPNLKRFQAAL